MSNSTTQDYRAYGNFIQQKSPGVFGAGMVATLIGLGGLVLAMFVMILIDSTTAFVVAGLAVLGFVMTGTPLGSIAVRRLSFFNTRRTGEHQWRSGMASRNASARARLPGMLGRTQLLERMDPFGVPFVVIHNPSRGGMFTIVARCVAEGPWMQDQDRIDAWVGRYARVLGACSSEPALVCAKAIGETAPDPGGRLEAMVQAERSPQSPNLARQVMDEIVADYPAASSENVTFFEMTFTGRGLDRKGQRDHILTELSRRVPGLMGQLAEAGGGSVSMVTADELPRIVRCAYDPAAQPFLERAELTAPSREHQQISWEDAGPVAAQEWWDHYTHDSGSSITWEMYGAPRSAVTEKALTGLLAPHPDFTRKRVALIYRPHSPEESTSVSEADANTATFLATQQKGRVKATASLAMRSTEQSRQEVASGASLVRWYVMVTATVRDPEDLDQAASNVEKSAGAVPMRLRRSWGSQGAAFAATLPVGFVPWEHTVIPDKVRELL